MARRSAKRRYYKKRYRKKKTWSTRRKYYRSKKWSKGNMPLGNKAEIAVPIRWNGQTTIDFAGYEGVAALGNNTNCYRMNKWSINFNPMNAMLCQDIEAQRILQMLDPINTSPVKYAEWVVNDSNPSNTSQTFYPNHFINQWYSPLFRWYLANYQEWKINYIMLKLTPMQATSSSGSYYPFKMCHFVDRKYTGKNGSAVERYMKPGASPKATLSLLEDCNKQGKKWKVFRSTDLASRSYKIYLKASGAQEKTTWYTTEATMTPWGAYDTNISPTRGYFCMQMWNDAISPNAMDALRHTQTGFCPEVVVVCMRDYAVDHAFTITFDWELEVGCSFRSPGKWVDGAAGDQWVWNWLNAPLMQLGVSQLQTGTEEEPLIPLMDDYHVSEPKYSVDDQHIDPTLQSRNMGEAQMRIDGKLVTVKNARYIGLLSDDVPVVPPTVEETRKIPIKEVEAAEEEEEPPEDEDEAELEDPGPAKKKKKRR